MHEIRPRTSFAAPVDVGDGLQRRAPHRRVEVEEPGDRVDDQHPNAGVGRAAVTEVFSAFVHRAAVAG